MGVENLRRTPTDTTSGMERREIEVLDLLGARTRKITASLRGFQLGFIAILCASFLLLAVSPAKMEKTQIHSKRPAVIYTPENIATARDGSVPLIVLLHGFTKSGDFHRRAFRALEYAKEKNAVLLTPDGRSFRFLGKKIRFWRATGGCCNLASVGQPRDDIDYIKQLIDEAKATYPAIDASRVYLLGHSNGAFLAYSVACQYSDDIAGLVAVSGSTYKDARMCRPTSRVSVVHVHGTEDVVVPTAGSKKGRFVWPPSRRAAERWAEHNYCKPSRTKSAEEIEKFKYGTLSVKASSWTTCSAEEGSLERKNCADIATVDYWEVEGMGHMATEIPHELVHRAVDVVMQRPKQWGQVLTELPTARFEPVITYEEISNDRYLARRWALVILAAFAALLNLLMAICVYRKREVPHEPGAASTFMRILGLLSCEAVALGFCAEVLVSSDFRLLFQLPSEMIYLAAVLLIVHAILGIISSLGSSSRRWVWSFVFMGSALSIMGLGSGVASGLPPGVSLMPALAMLPHLVRLMVGSDDREATELE